MKDQEMLNDIILEIINDYETDMTEDTIIELIKKDYKDFNFTTEEIQEALQLLDDMSIIELNKDYLNQ